MRVLRTALSFALVAWFAVALPGHGAAQEMGAPADLQLSLFARILAFDKALPDRVGDEIVIGVLYQEENRISREAMSELVAAAERSALERIGDLPVRLVPVRMEESASVPALIADHEIDVLYLTPLRAVSLDDVAASATRSGILTLTGVPSYLEHGIAVAIEDRNGRPGILINTVAAEKQGAALSAQLLRVARLTHEAPE